MSEKQQSEIENETIPSMDEFEDQIEKSFHKVNIGDIIKATKIGRAHV